MQWCHDRLAIGIILALTLCLELASLWLAVSPYFMYAKYGVAAAAVGVAAAFWFDHQHTNEFCTACDRSVDVNTAAAQN